MAGLPEKKEGHLEIRPILLAVLVGFSLFFSALFLLSPDAFSQRSGIEHGIQPPEASAAGEAGVRPPEPENKEKRHDFTLTGANTFYSVMSALDVPGADIQNIVQKARAVYDLRKLKVDTTLRVFTHEGQWKKIEYRFSEYEILNIEKDGETVKATKTELPNEKKQVVISGAIENSFYEDGVRAGADPQTIMSLTDIFAWDIDFASDIQKGDTFRILCEALYVEGALSSTGRILGAEMVNSGKKYTAIYYEGRNGGGFYDANGNSLRKTFLKSPLRFRRITSYFSKGRFHPILKTFRPHHGIDYGAPVGTPVEAAGNGVVTYAGWKGGYGKFVEIRHGKGYSTRYGHLSKIAKNVRTGSKVKQGDLIGKVGSTGLSTGPHLHYELKAAGKLINPLSVKAMPGVSIGKREKQKFASVSTEILKKLSDSSTAVASVAVKRAGAGGN